MMNPQGSDTSTSEPRRLRRRVSSADVARLAGLSRTTVSYVLNDRRDVAIPSRTRKRVLDAMEALGYRPDGVARSLVAGKTQTVGVIVPELDSSFPARVVNGIEHECTRHNYRLLLAYSHNDPGIEQQQARLLLEHRVDGLICVAGYRTLEGTDQWLEEVLTEQVPCIMVDDSSSTLPVDCVVSDDRSGAMSAVAHLIRLGHHRIAHLCAVHRGSPARERLAGYRAALQGAGMPLDETLIVGETFDPNNAGAAMRALLELREPPTAVFAANDYMAIAAIEVVQNRGKAVPEDIAMIGFSNSSVAEYMHLTTVRRSPEVMGKRAAGRLMQRLNRPDLPREAIMVSTHLIVRESCGSRRSGMLVDTA